MSDEFPLPRQVFLSPAALGGDLNALAADLAAAGWTFAFTYAPPGARRWPHRLDPHPLCVLQPTPTVWGYSGQGIPGIANGCTGRTWPQAAAALPAYLEAWRQLRGREDREEDDE